MRIFLLTIAALFTLDLDASAQLCGDCNRDGAISVLDALEAARDAVDLVQLQGEALRACDVDQSTMVSVLDAFAIAQVSAGTMLWLDCAARLPHELCVTSTGFTGGPGYSWPTPWRAVGGVDVADLQSGAGRLRPLISGYSLARMHHPGSETDVEVTFTVTFSNVAQQGCGFYVRQNGGYLQSTAPTGQGYAVFIEGFRGTDGIGIWKEENGVEIELQVTFTPTLGLTSGVPFRVRFRTSQTNPTTTRLRARIWPASAVEPSAWQIDINDTTPVLQGISGGFAVDAWSSLTPPAMPPAAEILIDDIKISRLVDPLAGLGATSVVASGFTFLEGPTWRKATNELLFCDVSANRIIRLTPPTMTSTFLTPAGAPSGLATAANGDLLVCEWSGHRLSRVDPLLVVTPVVTQFMGANLHSPNDLTVRSDGTIYFTDPPFGSAPPPPIVTFNGIFRVTPLGAVSADYMGAAATRPNGVILSPDETLLYATDWAAGTLAAFDVAPSGALSNRRVIASGATSADGMAIDVLGNVYVAYNAGIRVFDAWGVQLGNIAVGGGASNCEFGGADLRTLYITGGGTLRQLSMFVPGHQVF